MATYNCVFLAVLANVDSTIMNIKLDGFKIERVESKQAYQLLATLERTSPKHVAMKYFIEYSCVHPKEQCCYFLKQNLVLECMDDSLNPFIFAKYCQELYAKIKRCFALMRLYKEGDLFSPGCFIFMIDNGGEIVQLAASSTNKRVGSTLFRITEEEMEQAKGLLENIHLPFQDPVLLLAYQSFEMSYHVDYLQIAFLSAMIALEALLHPSNKDELRQRISRNAAVLLSKDKEEGRNIRKKVLKLYDMRSALVHTGKSSITMEDLKALRDIIRQCIIRINNTGQTVKEVLNLLDEIGYGEFSVN